MKILFSVLMVFCATITLADIIPGGKDGFVGTSIRQIHRVGEQTQWEEFVSPLEPGINKTLELNTTVVLSFKTDEIKFVSVEPGKQWQVYYTFVGGTWSNLFIDIEGHWNPVKNEADSTGASKVFKIILIPHIAMAIVECHVFGEKLDILNTVGTKSAPSIKDAMTIEKVVIATSHQLATAWGKIKSGK